MYRAVTSVFFAFAVQLSPICATAQNYERLFYEFRADGMSQADKRFLQIALAFSGHYNGLLDGDWGPISQRALNQYAWDEFGTSAEDWHMAVLAFDFFEEYERDGWAIKYFDGLDMSFLYPYDAVYSEPSSNNFVNWRHSRSSLSYSIGIHDRDTTQNIHNYTERSHVGRDGAYMVRRQNLAVTSATQSGGECCTLDPTSITARGRRSSSRLRKPTPLC